MVDCVILDISVQQQLSTLIALGWAESLIINAINITSFESKIMATQDYI